MPEHPLWYGIPLPHVRRVPVLGVPARFASNSEAVLGVVDERFGSWAATPAQLVAGEGVELRIVVHPGGAPGADPPITCRMPDPRRLLFQSGESMALVDLNRRDAIAYVGADLLEDRARFGYGLLDPMTLLLVTTQDRHPVHAALIGRGPVALLLAGPTGVGKSTLAYLAHHEGMRALSDDATYVQLRPTFRVWGMPGHLYLLPDSGRHFPAVQGAAERLPNGKEKTIVDTGSERGAGAPVATRAGVCLLQRNGGPVTWSTVTGRETAFVLEQGLGPQAPIYRDSMKPALSALCARGGWRLNLSSNPRDALPYIEQMLAELEAEP